MPGICGVVSKDELDTNIVTQGLASLRHLDDIRTERYLDEKHLFLGGSVHDTYPVESFESGEYLVIIEGMLYDISKDEKNHWIEDILHDVQTKGDYHARIRTFVESVDGDFNIVLVNRDTKEVTLFNDRWSRLPLYHFQNGDMFVFSREIKFILHFIPSITFNRTAMIEFISLFHGLGSSTLFVDIFRVITETVFAIARTESGIKITRTRLFEDNFDTTHSGSATEDYLKKARIIFMDSLKSRINAVCSAGYEPVIDVSGGYDTRAILAGASQLIPSPRTVTIDLVTGDETSIAIQVAALYGLEPVIIRSDPGMSRERMREIIFMTDCQVNIWTALHCFSDESSMKDHFGSKMARFSGLMGEFIRHPYKLRTYNKSLFEDVCARHGLNFERSCALFGMDQDVFLTHLKEYFNSYPEESQRGKGKHYYFDYMNHFTMGGEERHRLHFWTVQPFWSREFVSFSMYEIPWGIIDEDFYRKFLSSIDPRCCTIQIYGSSTKPTSRVSMFRSLLVTKLLDRIMGNRTVHNISSKIYRTFRKKNRKDEEYPLLMKWILHELKRMDIGSGYVDEEAIRELDTFELTKLDLYHLLSMLIYMNLIEERFPDKIVSS